MELPPGGDDFMAQKSGKIKSANKIFAVPAYSQFLDVSSPVWKRKACGAVSLKMVLDYLRPNSISISEIIKRGRRKNAFRLAAYIPNVGWAHKGLASLAEEFGFKGKNYDWSKKTPDAAYSLLLKKLQKRPIIASIYRNLKPGSSGHLVLLTGIKGNRIYYNDPDSKTRRGIKKTATLNKFLKGWKKRVVEIKLK